MTNSQIRSQNQNSVPTELPGTPLVATNPTDKLAFWVELIVVKVGEFVVFIVISSYVHQVYAGSQIFFKGRQCITCIDSNHSLKGIQVLPSFNWGKASMLLNVHMIQLHFYQPDRTLAYMPIITTLLSVTSSCAIRDMCRTISRYKLLCLVQTLAPSSLPTNDTDLRSDCLSAVITWARCTV